MSALELHDHEDQAGVSHYAPPRVRGHAEERTIRPILERLGRGEKDDNSHAASAQPLAEDAPLATRDILRAPKIPLSMAGRLALAVGLAVALAIPAAAFLTPRAEQTVPAVPAETPKKVPAETPKKVHTISIQAKKPITPELATTSVVKPPASPLAQPTPPKAQPASSAEQPVSLPVQAPASSAGDVGQAKPAQSRAENAPALLAPLKSWAMLPVDTASAGWTPAAQPPNQGAAEPPTEKSIHEPAASHTARPRRHHHVIAARHVRHHRRHYVRRHHRVRGHAEPQPAQQVAQPADSQTATVEQTKPNPIQAAINAILGKQ